MSRPSVGYRNKHALEELTEEKAFAKILRLATVREQSSVRLKEKLLRDGYPSSVVENAVSRAIACGVVDDDRYAEFYVRSQLSSGRGSLRIERELAEIGIAANDVEAYADHIYAGEEAEVTRAVDILLRKPPRSKNKRDAAFRKLVQQGYSVSVASRAARIWLDKLQAPSD